MKKAYLEEMLKKHADRWSNLLERIPGNFEVDDIHDLRVEFKKLRAFSRLLAYDSAGHWKLPPVWRQIYRKAGLVRDLQLYLPHLRAILPDSAECVIHQSRRLFAAKEKLLGAIETHDFSRSRDYLLSHLPPALTDEGIRRFMHGKIAALRIQLMALENDTDLHESRKILKDIFYNIRIFQNDWGLSFPITAWKNEKQIQELAQQLGEYNDICIQLDIQEDDIITARDESERALLIEKRENWLEEKKSLKGNLLERLRALKLNSSF